MPFFPFITTVYVCETQRDDEEDRRKTFLQFQFPDGQQKLLVTNHRPYLSTPQMSTFAQTHTCLSLGNIPSQTWSVGRTDGWRKDRTDKERAVSTLDYGALKNIIRRDGTDECREMSFELRNFELNFKLQVGIFGFRFSGKRWDLLCV